MALFYAFATLLLSNCICLNASGDSAETQPSVVPRAPRLKRLRLPFTVACCRDSLFFACFKLLFAIFRIVDVTVGTAQRNGYMQGCLNVPFVANSTPDIFFFFLLFVNPSADGEK